ncbi:hypothetical protein [Phenylobacterium sp.]|uniref:hypothetical protein n=1 Tax=Phenylobacterium sp. TaxID=1871053 RepID=UPI00286C121A|nr:hypothetical protein [Phenylobacterium sp.]
MSTEYSPFARPKFTAETFGRDDPATTFDSAPRVAPETRTFASQVETPRAAFVEPVVVHQENGGEEASMFAAAPLYGQRAKSPAKGKSVAPIALIAIPAVALLAGVAYFTMQPRDSLIAEQPATIATAPTTPTPLAPAPAEMAVATPAPAPVEAAAPVTAAPIAKVAAPRAARAAPARVASVRPAPAATPGAEDVSSWSRDANATLPSAPVPYSATAQTPSASPAPIIVPPVAAEPVTPTPQTVAPEVPAIPVP